MFERITFGEKKIEKIAETSLLAVLTLIWVGSNFGCVACKFYISINNNILSYKN